jgi:hypothetical protein
LRITTYYHNERNLYVHPIEDAKVVTDAGAEANDEAKVDVNAEAKADIGVKSIKVRAMVFPDYCGVSAGASRKE